MGALSGTIVASRIVPSDSLDAYATHDADYGRGGFRSVADIAERDAITAPRRKLGMKVFVNDIKKEYQLDGGLENANWVEVTGGAGGGTTLPDLTDNSGKVLSNDGNTLTWVELPSGGSVGGISYVWENEAARTAQAGMSTDEQGFQQDTNVVYKYDGTSWVQYYTVGVDLTNYYDKTEIDAKFTTASIDGLIPDSSHITTISLTTTTGAGRYVVISPDTWIGVPFNFVHKDDKSQKVNNTIVIADTGYYFISSTINISHDGSTHKVTEFKLKKNGIDIISESKYNPDKTQTLRIAVPLYLVQGDVLSVSCKTGHSSTPKLLSGPNTVGVFEKGCFMSVQKMTGVSTTVVGTSAYDTAVANGFVGTEIEWLETLKGDAGLSNYQIAVNAGFVGTEVEWLASLKGETGDGAGGISYVWATEAERLGQTGMVADEQGVQQDTNTVYKYDGNVWITYYTMSAGAGVTYNESVVEPADPNIGDEWFDQTDGTLYKRVSDGVNAVWMSVNNAVGNENSADYDIGPNEFLLPFTRGGKLVYGIEVDVGAMPNATTKSVAVPGLESTYVAWVDVAKSYVYAGDTYNEYYPSSMTSSSKLTHQIACWVSPKTQSVIIMTGVNRSNQTARIVINYTKD